MPNKKTTTPKKTINMLDSTGLDAISELINSPIRLFWLNFKTGFTRGMAGIFGAAVAILLIGFLVSQFGGAPLIGDFIQKIGAAAQIK